MKQVGIWLDKEKAHIVILENGHEAMETLASNIDHFHIHGGSGTKLKGGPQDVVQDSRYLEKEKQQTKTYFKNIASQIQDADALVLFGPAQTPERFSKELHANFPNLSQKLKGLRKSDSMTENQTKAWVRDFYKMNS